MTKQAKSSRKASNKVNLEAEVTLPVASDDSILDGLLDSLDTVEKDASIEAAADEVIEPAGGAVDPAAGAALGAADEALLNDIAADAEKIAGKQAIYAEQAGQPSDGSAPTVAPETTGKKAKKAKAPKTPKEPKTPRATSLTHSPGDLLRVKLGEKANEFLVFSANDAVNLNADDLKAKADEFIAKMNDREAIADKVKEKAIMLFTWMHKGGGPDKLNEVMRRAFTVLHETGELTSGDKGNLQVNLLTKPYSVGTARSQANQMFMLFPLLGITVKEKGKMVANPDSTLLPAIKQLLGLS